MALHSSMVEEELCVLQSMNDSTTKEMDKLKRENKKLERMLTSLVQDFSSMKEQQKQHKTTHASSSTVEEKLSLLQTMNNLNEREIDRLKRENKKLEKMFDSSMQDLFSTKEKQKQYDWRQGKLENMFSQFSDVKDEFSIYMSRIEADVNHLKEDQDRANKLETIMNEARQEIDCHTKATTEKINVIEKFINTSDVEQFKMLEAFIADVKVKCNQHNQSATTKFANMKKEIDKLKGLDVKPMNDPETFPKGQTSDNVQSLVERLDTLETLINLSQSTEEGKHKNLVFKLDDLEGKCKTIEVKIDNLEKQSKTKVDSLKQQLDRHQWNSQDRLSALSKKLQSNTILLRPDFATHKNSVNDKLTNLMKEIDQLKRCEVKPSKEPESSSKDEAVDNILPLVDRIDTMEKLINLSQSTEDKRYKNLDGKYKDFEVNVEGKIKGFEVKVADLSNKLDLHQSKIAITNRKIHDNTILLRPDFATHRQSVNDKFEKLMRERDNEKTEVCDLGLKIAETNLHLKQYRQSIDERFSIMKIQINALKEDRNKSMNDLEVSSKGVTQLESVHQMKSVQSLKERLDNMEMMFNLSNTADCKLLNQMDTKLKELVKDLENHKPSITRLNMVTNQIQENFNKLKQQVEKQEIVKKQKSEKIDRDVNNLQTPVSPQHARIPQPSQLLYNKHPLSNTTPVTNQVQHSRLFYQYNTPPSYLRPPEGQQLPFNFINQRPASFHFDSQGQTLLSSLPSNPPSSLFDTQMALNPNHQQLTSLPPNYNNNYNNNPFSAANFPFKPTETTYPVNNQFIHQNPINPQTLSNSTLNQPQTNLIGAENLNSRQKKYAEQNDTSSRKLEQETDSSSNMSQEKQVLGECLFRLVKETQPDFAAKITGMILELKTSEVIDLVGSKELLELKIKEALDVLNHFQVKHKPTCDEKFNAVDWQAEGEIDENNRRLLTSVKVGSDKSETDGAFEIEKKINDFDEQEMYDKNSIDSENSATNDDNGSEVNGTAMENYSTTDVIVNDTTESKNTTNVNCATEVNIGIDLKGNIEVNQATEVNATTEEGIDIEVGDNTEIINSTEVKDITEVKIGTEFKDNKEVNNSTEVNIATEVNNITEVNNTTEVDIATVVNDTIKEYNTIEMKSSTKVNIPKVFDNVTKVDNTIKEHIEDKNKSNVVVENETNRQDGHQRSVNDAAKVTEDVDVIIDQLTNEKGAQGGAVRPGVAISYKQHAVASLEEKDDGAKVAEDVNVMIDQLSNEKGAQGGAVRHLGAAVPYKQPDAASDRDDGMRTQSMHNTVSNRNRSESCPVVKKEESCVIS